MTWRKAIARTLFLLLCAGSVTACASSYPSRSVSYKDTPLEQPTTPPSDAQLLGVRIESFEPGRLPDDPKLSKGLSTEIRAAETYYFAVQLKETMQRSGHWGPVRVVPRGAREGEVNITGKILESDAEMLKLEVTVKDAGGALWFTKTYESVVDSSAYGKASGRGVDAFQGLYNEIANDVAAHKKSFTDKDFVGIRQVADLRFGAEFSPSAYEGYLSKADAEGQPGGLGRAASLFSRKSPERKPVYVVSRLPAEDDSVVQRVSRIRAREDLLIDTLDQQYEGLARSVRTPYDQWRTSRLREIEALREVDRVNNQEKAKAVAVGTLAILAGAALAAGNKGGNCYGCATTGAVVAGAGVAIAVQMASKASEQAESEANLRRANLIELGNSLRSDVQVTVVEVEGKTIELKGSIEEKFKNWKAALEELRASERGTANPAPVAPGS